MKKEDINTIKEIVGNFMDLVDEHPVKVSKTLYEGVKRSTEGLIESQPGIKLEEIFDILADSSKISSENFLKSKEYDDAVNLIINELKNNLTEYDDYLDMVLRSIIKEKLVRQIVKGNIETSRAAINDLWNGRMKME